GGTAAAGIIVAAVLAVGLIGSAGPPQSPAGSPREVAYVVAHTQAAFADQRGYILRIQSQYRDGSATRAVTTWSDSTSGESRTDERQAGRLTRSALISGADGADTLTMSIVDYRERTWLTQQVFVLHPRGLVYPYPTPATLREALAKGLWTIVGRERVDG